jgi:flagellar hook-length control protein FliK
MNNALNVLNISRATNHGSTSSVAGAVSGDAQPSKGFDSAMDAAHAAQSAHANTQHAAADARSATRVSPAKHADTPKKSDATDDTSPAKAPEDAKAAASKTGKDDTTDADDDAKKKDDTSSDGTSSDGISLATTMLALIGVPPKVTELAGKAMATLRDATGKTGTAIGGALGLGLPATGAAATADGMTDGAKDALLAGNGAMSEAIAAPATTASPFAALLAAKGDILAGAKDDPRATDPTTSPMPLTHTPSLSSVVGPVVQVQATQVATSPQFAQELGEQISWMGSGQIKEARIKLHPEELGSMDVRVNMDGGKVNVAIIAQHPAAVHAVQQTLAQLDSMLAHHGLSLGQADVGQRQAGQGNQGGTQGGQDGTGADDPAGATGAVATSRVSRSLVDEVA